MGPRPRRRSRHRIHRRSHRRRPPLLRRQRVPLHQHLPVRSDEEWGEWGVVGVGEELADADTAVFDVEA